MNQKKRGHVAQIARISGAQGPKFTLAKGDSVQLACATHNDDFDYTTMLAPEAQARLAEMRRGPAKAEKL